MARTLLDGVDSILDVGCGAGMGAKLLGERARHVIGLDVDPDAVAFAKLFAPGPDYIVADSHRLPNTLAYGGAVVIDSLASVESPFATLQSVRNSMKPGGLLIVAEPRAHVAQVLLPPIHRAFSHTSLDVLVRSAGFEPVRWLPDTQMFIFVGAVAVERPGRDDLGRGFAALRARDANEALAAFAAARTAGDPCTKLEALLGEAQVRMSLGQGDGAGSSLLQALELAPHDARPHAHLSMLSTATGALLDAQFLLERALKIDATEPLTWCAYAQFLDCVGDPSALTAWKTAFELAPSQVPLAVQLAQALAVRGAFDDAVGTLERVGEYGATQDVNYHVLLARLLIAAGRSADAKIEARVAHAQAPDDTDVVALCSELAVA
jgi:predicted TPR repeat methyltransferase